MNDPVLPLAGLSPVCGKKVVAGCDGGELSSDGGIVVLREVEQRLRVADRLAACIEDPRAPDRITHSLADIMGFGLPMIAAGYEDGNDADALRCDPMFKMALDLTPSDRQLCSQPTISRLENLPDARALLRMGRAMVDVYCESFRQVPKRIVVDIDDTFDAVHGGQQLRLFNAHHDEYGFQPIPACAGDRVRWRRPLHRRRFASRQTARRQGDQGLPAPPVAGDPRQLAQDRNHVARRQSLLLPRDLDFCRIERLDYILGVAPSPTLRTPVVGLETSTKARYEAAPKDGKARRYKEFYDGAASWSRVERIIARVEGGSGRPRLALRRHQSETAQRPQALRGWLLPARPGGKS